jgi:hypothetical protein
MQGGDHAASVSAVAAILDEIATQSKELSIPTAVPHPTHFDHFLSLIGH